MSSNKVWLVMDALNQVHDVYANPEAAYKHARGTSYRVVEVFVKSVYQTDAEVGPPVDAEASR